MQLRIVKMKVSGVPYRTIWHDDSLKIIDQSPKTGLPHNFRILELKSVDDVCYAIKEMQVRGAGLIGAAAGYGMFLGAEEAWDRFEKQKSYSPEKFDDYMQEIGNRLKSTRPTAVNLACAVDRQLKEIKCKETLTDKVNVAFDIAEKIANEDAEMCKRIGENGFSIIRDIYLKKGDVVNVLTHCNAGWLAFVDYGSALSPVYEAYNKGIPVHVWVDMTGPWNQGGRLTAWELVGEKVPHTVIADNTGGHLMQHGKVDLVIVGADRVTRTGDAANKIGTYLKALAARDNYIPFYVAFPSSTFDWNLKHGKDIPIEERSSEEVKYAEGLLEKTGTIEKVLLTTKDSHAENYSFDVTPARLISGLITERGIISPVNEQNILELYPEQRKMNQ
jgi:methylthioribose-1-phosphate isomerase